MKTALQSVNEASSATCVRVWNDAARSLSVRLLYPEARVALAKAARMGRITGRQLAAGVGELETIITEIDHIEVTAELAHAALTTRRRHLRTADESTFTARLTWVCPLGGDLFA